MANHLRFGETFLVAQDKALAATGSLLPSTGSSVNLTEGQLGMVCTAHNSTRGVNNFVQAGDTKTTAPKVKFVQGTSKSADFSSISFLPTGVQAYIASPEFDGNSTYSITARLAFPRVRSSKVIGDANGQTGALTVRDGATYTLTTTLVGRRQDKYTSSMGVDSLTVNFVSPTYSTTGISAAANKLNHIIQNLAYKINDNSTYFAEQRNGEGNFDVVAFAIKKAGSVSGTDINVTTLSVGDTINVVKFGTTTYTYTVDQPFLDTIEEAIANSVLTADSEISLIDIDAAITGAGNANADMIMVMALDHELAIVRDEVINTTPNVDVGVEYSFESGLSGITIAGSTASDPQGTGRTWLIDYQNYADLLIYSQQIRPHDDYQLVLPNDINTNAVYTSYIITEKRSIVKPFVTENRDQRVIILAPTVYSGYQEFTGDNATTAFVSAVDITSADDVEVYEDGVLQTITTHYTVNTGTDTVTFVTAPGTGDDVRILVSDTGKPKYYTASTLLTSLNAVVGPWLNSCTIDTTIGTGTGPNFFV